MNFQNGENELTFIGLGVVKNSSKFLPECIIPGDVPLVWEKRRFVWKYEIIAMKLRLYFSKVIGNALDTAEIHGDARNDSDHQ